MVRWLFKYGALIFLFNTVFLSIEATYTIGNQIFLGLMILFSFVLIINPKNTKKILLNKAFLFLLILNAINLSYWLLFHDISDLEALKYLLARGVQFSIISVSICYTFFVGASSVICYHPYKYVGFHLLHLWRERRVNHLIFLTRDSKDSGIFLRFR